MRKLSKILVFTCALVAIHLHSSNDKDINALENLLVFFLLMTPNKSSSTITLANSDSQFNIEYHSPNQPHVMIVSLQHILTSFSSVCVSADFHLAFLHANPISFTQFLTAFTNIVSCFDIYFFVNFSIFHGILLWDFYPDTWKDFVVYQYVPFPNILPLNSFFFFLLAPSFTQLTGNEFSATLHLTALLNQFNFFYCFN